MAHLPDIPLVEAEPLSGNDQTNGNIEHEPELSHPKRIRLNGDPFCVLCFDGGGYRNYASLLILKKILRVKQPEGPIFPYLYFDLICGTSTGGIIAILLAVLYLDIDTAIRIYSRLDHTIFGSSWRGMRLWMQDTQFNNKLMKNAIADILDRFGHTRTYMHEPVFDRDCACFVPVAYVVGSNKEVLCIQSYKPQTIPNDHQWTIMDVALAATAAPTYFNPHVIQKERYSYVFEDAGANGVNNPVELALDECENLVGREHACYIVSIGTRAEVLVNKQNHKQQGKFLRTVGNMFDEHRRARMLAEAFAKDASDRDEVDRRMTANPRNGLQYSRFEADLGEIDLAGHEALPSMELAVERFVKNNDVKTRIGTCISRLKNTSASAPTEVVDDGPMNEVHW